MPPRRRILAPLALLCVCAAVFSATAAGLYQLTDDELTGPEQPIDFSHKKHAGELGIDCQYCHTSAATSQAASVPALSTCMGCHQWVKEGSSPGSAEEIAKIHEHYDEGKPVEWVRIHNVPDHVQFKHFRHVQADITCQTCHGTVEEMNRVWLVPDTKTVTAWLPAAKLEMGWCMDCHLEKGASDDCAACHY